MSWNSATSLGGERRGGRQTRSSGMVVITNNLNNTAKTAAVPEEEWMGQPVTRFPFGDLCRGTLPTLPQP